MDITFQDISFGSGWGELETLDHMILYCLRYGVYRVKLLDPVLRNSTSVNRTKILPFLLKDEEPRFTLDMAKLSLVQLRIAW